VNPAGQAYVAAVAEARVRLAARSLAEGTIHETRKALKRARAALRLLRPALGEAAFRAENAALRDAGRCLSPLRDPRSALATLRSLAERERRAAGPGVARRLEARESRARRAVRLEDCLRILERSRHDEFTLLDPARLEEGLRGIYRKGRRKFAKAGDRAGTEALHEWRKDVKYLLNALQLLGLAESKPAKRAGRLAERLGEDHDLALLGRDAPALHPTIEERRARLRKDALALGKKLYAKKPKRYARVRG
jgi:CHAD domain-containing protein